MARLKGERAFVITDKSRRNYLARRLDGRKWEHISSKAYTLPDSQAKWPIGIQEAGPFPAIALCEGGPDFLAAFGHALASSVENLVAPHLLEIVVKQPKKRMSFGKLKDNHGFEPAELRQLAGVSDGKLRIVEPAKGGKGGRPTCYVEAV
jgi:hypothetical protein